MLKAKNWWSNVKNLIHFAHGNGFPALCYKSMLDQLGPHFSYCYIDKVGHNSQYPVSENWPHLVDEVLYSIKSQTDKPVWAVGHSLGGVLHLMAAVKEPQLFQAVILLDSPLIGPFKSKIIYVAKKLGLIDSLTPAGKTKGRCRNWQNYEQLLGYLKTRALFKNFCAESLDDYIHYGLEQRESGYYLRFDPEVEYQIYRTIPHCIPNFQGQLKVKAALIYGNKSDVVNKADIRYMAKNFNIRYCKTEGTHLFPMEHPKATAAKIRDVIETIN